MKPILFNTEMARAILDGRKTVTRRVAFKADELREFPCSSYPDGWWFRGRVYARWEKAMKSAEGVMSLCKYRPGDILWVRETWAKDIDGEFVYRTDYGTTEDDGLPPSMFKWRPSIHMPREAARIFLRVKYVRVERLQDISLDPPGPDNQTVREGFKYLCDFIATWNNTIKPADRPKYGWEANPWVWVISFEKITKEEAENKRR